MEISQAITIIKQTINEAIKSGKVKNIEQAAAICESWALIIRELNEANKKKQTEK